MFYANWGNSSSGAKRKSTLSSTPRPANFATCPDSAGSQRAIALLPATKRMKAMTELLLQPVDERDRAQTLETHKSFLVQAPAGSGKTELLTPGLLNMLANWRPSAQILPN